ncbi:MAG: type II toxin-antitoxin system VapC family toxin [Deltaproteobacteria bacterium]|nr:type II toxin-antitoxin system VapC family toxin [Deltaproteobacteria bacterium]
MNKGKVVDLNTSIAVNASKISLQYSLPMADSIILSTARAYTCIVWTQDSDFKDIPDVKFFPKCLHQANPAES